MKLFTTYNIFKINKINKINKVNKINEINEINKYFINIIILNIKLSVSIYISSIIRFIHHKFNLLTKIKILFLFEEEQSNQFFLIG
jgi:hypothetical protein